MKNEIQGLVMIAKELIGAKNDLASILDMIPAMEEKRAERVKKEEEYRQETNRMYAEEMKEISEQSNLLKADLKEAIIGYFQKNGMGIRKTGGEAGEQFGLELFIGNGDGINRQGSKVVVHLSIGIGESLGHRDRDAYFFLRNDDPDGIDDRKFLLPEKDTVKNMLKMIEKADKRGYWKNSYNRGT